MASGNANARIICAPAYATAKPAIPPIKLRQYALGKYLADKPRSACSKRHSERDLGAARGASRQQQVGYVRAGDEQDNGGKDHKHLQASAGLLLHDLDASASRHDDDMLLGNLGGAAVFGIA